MLMLKTIAQAILPLAIMFGLIGSVFVLNLMFWGGML
jgi:hypothetical protein